MENHASDPRETLWRRQLTAAEQAALRDQPELAAEARLTEALAKLPDAPVPSNFTARVLNAIEREDQRTARAAGWPWNWRSLFPRLTVAAAVLIFAGMSIQRYEIIAHRHEMALSMATVAGAKSLPSMDALENLDVIQRMSQSAHADGDLLADLQ